MTSNIVIKTNILDDDKLIKKNKETFDENDI
jgi:hypothetical protein